MKSFLISLAASVALLAGPALAQQHTGHDPAAETTPAKEMDMSTMSDASIPT